jgi:hypothetical protein
LGCSFSGKAHGYDFYPQLAFDSGLLTGPGKLISAYVLRWNLYVSSYQHILAYLSTVTVDLFVQAAVGCSKTS